MRCIRPRLAILCLVPLVFLGGVSAAIRAAAEQELPKPPATAGTDVYGDPLPPNARARLGTVRLRHAGADDSHGASVTCLAYAPDGSSVASGGGEGTVRVWEVRSGKELVRLRGHQGPLSSVAFSPDGRRLISGGGDTMLATRKLSDGDKTARIWDVATGRELRSLSGHLKGVTAVAFSPDGTRVATGSLDATVRVWDPASGEQLVTLDGYEGGVSSLFFTPDGRSLVTADGAHRILIREWSTGKETFQIPLGGRKGKWPNRDVSTIALSADGRTIVSVSGPFTERSVRLWEVATGREIPGAWGGIGIDCTKVATHYAGLFSPDGKTLALRGGAGNLHLWDVASQRRLQVLVGHEYDVLAFAFSPDGRILASGDDDRTIRFWDVGSGKEIEKTEAHGAWVDGVAFSPDGKTVATIGGDAKVFLWDPASGRQIRRLDLPGRQSRGKGLIYSPDGEFLLSSSRDGFVRFWDPAKGREVRAWNGCPPDLNECGEIESFAISRDGKFLAISSLRTPRVLDTATGKELARGKDQSAGVSTLAFRPDGRLLFVTRYSNGAGKGPVLQAWDWALNRLVREVELDPKSFSWAVLSPDGRLLAVCADKGAVSLRETATLKEVLRLRAEARFATSAAFAPDSQSVATGGYDHLLRVWDTSDGRKLAELDGHAEHLSAIAYSPDGKSLATASSDTTGLVWDVSGFAARTPPAKIADEQLEVLWTDLSETEDAAKAYRAVGELSRAESSVVPYLTDRALAPAHDAVRLKELLAGLDHSDAAERGRATAELERIADEDMLLAASKDRLGAEARGRLDSILRTLDNPFPKSGQVLRSIRLVQVLERTGGAEAMKALQRLAEHNPDGRRAREARAALERLRR